MAESPFEKADLHDDLELESGAEVACPHCGEVVEIVLDPGGGDLQEYVEDCEVCCRPWSVRLEYDGYGHASVTVEPA